MLRISKDSHPLVGSILLEPRLVRARALALLNASSGENCIAGLQGYLGAVMFVCESANKLFELVFWDSFGAFKAVQHDYRYFDHIPVVAAHASRGHLCLSPQLFTAGDLAFRRGDAVQISVATADRRDSEHVAAAASARAAALPGTLYHIGQAMTGGFTVVTASWGPHEPATSFLPDAVESWRYDFTITDANSRNPVSPERGLPHRMYTADGAVASSSPVNLDAR